MQLEQQGVRGRRGTLSRGIRFAIIGALAATTSCGVGKVGSVPDATSGRLVVFASDRNVAVGQFDIYLYDLTALGFRLLLNMNDATHADLNPAISSDAQIVAFVSNRPSGMGGTDIYLYDRVSGGLFNQIGLNTTGNEDDPAFTGNATRLAFTRDTLGHRRVRLLDALSDQLVKMRGLDTLATFDDWAPAPNLDGSRIAFVSNRNGNADIFVYDATGDSLLNVPELVSDSTETDPTLSSDGRYLCFASTRPGGSGGFDLYLFDLTTRLFIPLPNINSAKDERKPSISAAGSVIVFQSTRTGGLGKTDIWNYDRLSGSVGQALGESSVSDDLDPCVLWQ